MEVDQAVQILAQKTGRPALSPAGAFDLVSEALSQPISKKMKVVDNRKVNSEATEPSSGIDWSLKLREKLNKARSTMKAVASDTRKLMERTSDVEMRSHLEKLLSRTSDAYTAVDSLLEKNGDISNLSRPTSTGKSMSDASTDMELTPAHWDSLATRTAAASRQKRPSKPPALQLPPDTEADTGMETEAEEWSKVVGRRTKKVKTTTAATSRPPAAQPQRPSGFSKKAPAILIRNAEGKTYRDTVMAVRNCGLSREDIGTNVLMRQTRDGSLLLELPKGANSTTAAKSIVSAMSAKLGESVGRVQQLGLQVEVEVLDIDAAATGQEVLEALRNAIPGQEDPASRVDREAISDVRIWATRSGQQIATAKMPKHLATAITRVPIGWTMCRVRPRTLPPSRCFRCHAFGHNTRECKAADRTGACWRCGVIGHSMRDCGEPDDRCVACESAGFPRVPHKPGSGACAARRQSAGVKPGRDD